MLITDFLSNVISKPCLLTKLSALFELWRVSYPLNIIPGKDIRIRMIFHAIITRIMF